MTENLESSPLEGSAGAPTSAASQGTGVQPPSTFDAAKLPEQLESIVAKAVEKAVQSTKDRRFSSIEKQLDDFKPVMEQVRSMLTPEQLAQFNQIQRDAEFEQMKQTVAKLTGTSTPAVGNQQSAAKDATQIVLETLQLDSNDAGVLKIVAENPDPIQRAARLGEYKAKLAPKQPDPALAPPLQGSAPVAKPDEAATLAKMKEWQKEPLKYREEIAKAKKELGWT